MAATSSKRKRADPPSKASNLSNEIVQSSDDASDSDAEPQAKAAKTKKTTTPRKSQKSRKSQNGSPSDSDSDNNSDSISDVETNPTTGENTPNTSKSAPATGTNSSPSASEPDSAQVTSKKNAVNGKTNGRSTPIDIPVPASREEGSVTGFRPTTRFKPPHSFKAISSTILSTKLTSLIAPHLKGKQIWHVSAPDTVPISSVREATMDLIKSGRAVASKKNDEFGFVRDALAEHETKSVAFTSKDGFIHASKRVGQTINLQHVVKLPQLNREAAIPQQTPDPEAPLSLRPDKPARPQPKGMRFRFRPSGFGDGEAGEIGSSESEPDVVMQESTPVEKAANGKESAKKKRKHGEGEKDEDIPATANGLSSKATETEKSKKKRKRDDGEEGDTQAQANELSSQSKGEGKKTAKKRKNDGEGNTDSPVPGNASSTKPNEAEKVKKKHKKGDGEPASVSAPVVNGSTPDKTAEKAEKTQKSDDATKNNASSGPVDVPLPKSLAEEQAEKEKAEKDARRAKRKEEKEKAKQSGTVA
ncbi:hypothetical protein K402DRAFT_391974 [Aulographum hederae CBS 113979]|uniref:Uncharacterized protein n=1 Tax=Aulographum hederae CBS 113979 TaxID=1176131 RepID=A0A6G1H5C9_9PEZI|nr:hypothetical protein K402DRAFT_391974 [Aulographum hederae CBS 113979]